MKKFEYPLGESMPKDILVVACQHGNERFGAQVLQLIEHEPNLAHRVDTVIANPVAFNRNVRFIQSDMNRLFGPNKTDSYERRQAIKLFGQLPVYKYIVDLHTTTAEVEGVIIAPDLFKPTQRVINAFNREAVAVMPRRMSESSLIGSRRGSSMGAIALEYNVDFARTEDAHAEVLNGLEKLADDSPQLPIRRDVYFVNGVIPVSTELRTDQNYNFQRLPDGRHFGFLVNEASYTNHRGFRGLHKTEMEI